MNAARPPAGDRGRQSVERGYRSSSRCSTRRRKHVLARPNVGRRPACTLRELASLCLILRESEPPRIGLLARSERGDTACCKYAGELVAAVTLAQEALYHRNSDQIISTAKAI